MNRVGHRTDPVHTVVRKAAECQRFSKTLIRGYAVRTHTAARPCIWNQQETRRTRTWRSAIKDALEDIFGKGIKAQGRCIAGKAASKVIGKHVSKTAGKALARTAASPWLLAADAAEFATERIARIGDCDQGTVKAVSKGAGFATSTGIGAAVAGGAALWAVGEVIGWFFD